MQVSVPCQSRLPSVPFPISFSEILKSHSQSGLVMPVLENLWKLANFGGIEIYLVTNKCFRIVRSMNKSSSQCSMYLSKLSCTIYWVNITFMHNFFLKYIHLHFLYLSIIIVLPNQTILLSRYHVPPKVCSIHFLLLH